jgi:hypothetical protein
MNAGGHSVSRKRKVPALPSYCMDIPILAKETLALSSYLLHRYYLSGKRNLTLPSYCMDILFLAKETLALLSYCTDILFLEKETLALSSYCMNIPLLAKETLTLPSYCMDILFLTKETLFNQGKAGQTNSHDDGTSLVLGGRRGYSSVYLLPCHSLTMMGVRPRLKCDGTRA